MTFSMVIWGLWSQDWLYPFLKSLGEVKNRDSLALPLVEFHLRHWLEVYSDTVFSWLTWVGRTQGSYTRDQPLSLSLLCPSIQLQTWTQVWIQERFAWSGYGFFCYLYLTLFLYHEEHLLTNSNDLLNGYTHITTISIQIEMGYAHLPRKVPCSPLQPNYNPHPGQVTTNIILIFSSFPPLYCLLF